MTLLKKIRGKFGRLVIGEEAAAAQKEHKTIKKAKFGPLVTGSGGVVKGTNTPVAGSKPIEAGTTSISKMKEILANNPAFLMALVEQEFAREPQMIRAGAMQLFVEVAPIAYKGDDEPKATAVIARCNAWLVTRGDPEKMAELDVARTRQMSIGERTIVVPPGPPTPATNVQEMLDAARKGLTEASGT